MGIIENIITLVCFTVLAVVFELCDMPSANHIWGAYLRRNGFTRNVIDDHGQDVYR